jgi:dTDP-4-dehydrorhamnose 3,5-epimerase and related enzymes
MNNLDKKIVLYTRKLIKDDRGWFLKAITGKENGLQKYTGEVYFTSGIKGKKKGAHYHPKAQEWFTVIQGKALLKLEDIETHERKDIILDSQNPITVFIPRMVAHSIETTEDCNSFILCAYTDLLYDPKDTIAYEIL